MHSFQPSRGRVLFEALCALTVAASLAGAWQQTGATALLPAAAAVALYALVHLFDMRRRKPVAAVEPQRIDFVADEQVELMAQLDAEAPLVADDHKSVTDAVVEDEEVAKLSIERSVVGRRKGGSRKGNGRRAGAPKAEQVIELAPDVDAEAVEPLPVEEVEITEPAPHEESEAGEFEEPIAHLPHAPLFEPDPFVRMARPAFGRRGRL